jgi:hypothetical protein
MDRREKVLAELQQLAIVLGPDLPSLAVVLPGLLRHDLLLSGPR